MLHVLYNLLHQMFRGGPPNQKFSRLLVSSDFSQCNSTWPVPLVFSICPWLFAFLMPSPCSCCCCPSGFILGQCWCFHCSSFSSLFSSSHVGDLSTYNLMKTIFLPSIKGTCILILLKLFNIHDSS